MVLDMNGSASWEIWRHVARIVVHVEREISMRLLRIAALPGLVGRDRVAV